MPTVVYFGKQGEIGLYIIEYNKYFMFSVYNCEVGIVLTFRDNNYVIRMKVPVREKKGEKTPVTLKGLQCINSWQNIQPETGREKQPHSHFSLRPQQYMVNCTKYQLKYSKVPLIFYHEYKISIKNARMVITIIILKCNACEHIFLLYNKQK